jgi:hypothetical protein
MRSLFMTMTFLMWSSVALALLQIGLWLITKGNLPIPGMFVNAFGGWLLFGGCRTYYSVMTMKVEECHDHE